MKKVLIISYFAPPCNLTAAQRIEGWVKYFHEFNYFPIIITRNWDNAIIQPKDIHVKSGEHTKIERFISHEIHYLPYIPSLRDRLFTKGKFPTLSKLLTLKELIFENFFISASPYSNIYNYASKYLSIHPNIKLVIISGGPFAQFKFGYSLKRIHKIKWIADYRDDWSTSELKSISNSINRFLRKLNSRSEKKWVRTAQLITTVSPFYANKLQKFTGVNSEVIENGYFELNRSKKHRDEYFTITYNGTLYPTQEIEPFIEVVTELILDLNIKIKLKFPGLAFDPVQKERIEKLTSKIKKFVLITDRIPKSEVLKIQSKSDLLLMLSHKGLKGVPSSKLYEYISFQKPILQVYPDDDIAQEILTKTKLGLFPYDKGDIKNMIINLVLNYNELHGNLDEVLKYSRREQTKKLSQLLDKI